MSTRSCDVNTSSWEFKCKKCGCFSSLVLEQGQNFDWVQCPDCKSKEMEITSYAAYDNASLKSLAERVSNLEFHFKRVLNELDLAEDEGFAEN